MRAQNLGMIRGRDCCGLLVLERVLSWMGTLIACLLVMWLVIGTSGCSVTHGSTYRAERIFDDSEHRYPFLTAPAGVYGEVPVWWALHNLEERGVVKRYPKNSNALAEKIQGREDMTVREAVYQIEQVARWVFDPETQSFFVATATHTIEDPDSFGRPMGEIVDRQPRAAVVFCIRFRALTGSASRFGLTGSFASTYFWGSIAEGVHESWSKNTERSFINKVQDTESGRTVETEREVVTAGLSLQGIAARLPGGMCRVDGRLNISSFVGGTSDRSTVDTPLQIDGPRGVWIPILRVQSGDIGGGVEFDAIRDFAPSASADAIEVAVKVE